MTQQPYDGLRQSLHESTIRQFTRPLVFLYVGVGSPAWCSAGKLLARSALAAELSRPCAAASAALFCLPRKLPTKDLSILTKLVPGMTVLRGVPLLHQHRHQVLAAPLCCCYPHLLSLCSAHSPPQLRIHCAATQHPVPRGRNFLQAKRQERYERIKSILEKEKERERETEKARERERARKKKSKEREREIKKATKRGETGRREKLKRERERRESQ